MQKKLSVSGPLLLLPVLAVLFVNAEVNLLSKGYLPPEAAKAAQKTLADEPAPAAHTNANDSFQPGLMLPSGYAIPTGSNVGAPQASPPNFPLPAFPPYFGSNLGQIPPEQFPGGSFGAAQGGSFPSSPLGGGFPLSPQGNSFAVAQQGGPFPSGPQGGPFPSGPQGGSFGGGPQGNPFAGAPQAGPFPGPPQAGPYPGVPQPGQFPGAPQSGPFPGQAGPFPAGPQTGPHGLPFPPVPQGPSFPPLQGGPFPPPPNYLISQGLPSAGVQLPFQQNIGFGNAPGFNGPHPPQPYQHLLNVGQPFSPSFGLPNQHYPFADEPQPKKQQATPKSSPTTTTTTAAPKSAAKSISTQNRDTVYASNGGYIY